MAEKQVGPATPGDVFAGVLEVLWELEHEARQCAALARSDEGEALRLAAGMGDVSRRELASCWEARAAGHRDAIGRVVALLDGRLSQPAATYSIRQDLRAADPDRVAEAFRRDLDASRRRGTR